MNNKGFTLVELLVTIAILGLVIAIAVPSYTGISNAIRESQRKNIVKKIENAASNYAFDTGETIIFVDTLVTEGYLNIDDDSNDVSDPVNNERLNCYIVEMEKKGDYYSAKFIDEKNYDNNGVCDLSKLNSNSENVSILVNGSENISDNWYTGTVTLKAHSNNTLVIDCTNNSCVWTSSSGASITGDDNVTISNVNGILETKYTFQYTVYTDDGEIKRYTTSVNLKIDNANPVIYNEQITVSNRYIYTDTKTVKIVASDGKGSGIVGYYLGNDITSCNSLSLISKYQSSNTFVVSENGSYIICVKDGVGKVSQSSINISYIS